MDVVLCFVGKIDRWRMRVSAILWREEENSSDISERATPGTSAIRAGPDIPSMASLRLGTEQMIYNSRSTSSSRRPHNDREERLARDVARQQEFEELQGIRDQNRREMEEFRKKFESRRPNTRRATRATTRV